LLESVRSVGGGCGERDVSFVVVVVVIRRGRLVSTEGAGLRSAQDPGGDGYSRQWTPARAGAVWALTERSSVVAPRTSAAPVAGHIPLDIPAFAGKNVPVALDRLFLPFRPGVGDEDAVAGRSSLGLSQEPFASPSGLEASCLRQTSSPVDCPILMEGSAMERTIPGSSVEEVDSLGRGGAGSSNSTMDVAAATAASSAIVVGCSIVAPERQAPPLPLRSGSPKGCPAATVRCTNETAGQGHYSRRHCPCGLRVLRVLTLLSRPGNVPSLPEGRIRGKPRSVYSN